MTYFYDLAGRVSETRDTRGYTVNGLVYDKNNNLTAYQSGVKDEHINFAYNTKYTYNNLNALTKMSFNVPGGYDSGTLRYGYDGLGRLTAKKSVLVAEDESTTAVEEKGLITTFTYKTATDSNGDTLRTLQPSTTHITDDYNGTVDVKYYDTYYADGSLKRSRITENGTHRYTYYTYDTLGQLIKQYSSYDLNTYNYTYDDGGNLTGKSYVVDTDTVYSATYTYDSNFSDLLTAYTKTEDGVTTTRTYAYNTDTDGNNVFGNPLSITETANGVTTTKALTWREGRTLESITTPDGTIEYEYNDNGLRISRRTAAGDTYLYHYNGSQLEYIEMLDANGTLTNTLRYIYNSGGQAEYILHSPAAYANKPGVYSLYYILRDNTGSIHKLIRVRKPNSAATGVQTVVETAVEYKYDPYGKLLSATGTDSIATLNPLIYKDYLYDSDTNWYYCNSRYYDPETGRFVNSDTLIDGKNLLGHNLFIYCFNNPTNCFDPKGQETYSLSCGFSAYLFAGLSYSYDLSFDTYGNLALQKSEANVLKNAHGVVLGTVSIGPSLTVSHTQLETVYDLEGVSITAGASVSIPSVASYGMDEIYDRDFNSVGSSMTIGRNYGSTVDLHAKASETSTIFSFNWRKALDTLCDWFMGWFK